MHTPAPCLSLPAACRPPRPKRRGPVALLLQGLLALALLAATPAFAQTLNLRVLGITDIHMHLLGWDYYRDQATDEYGLARTATLIRQARAEARNTVLVDNGDLLQGSPLGDHAARVQPLAPGEVHPAIAVLNALGVDAMAIGNHEFNYGLPFLDRALQGARFPVLSANVHWALPGARPEEEPFRFQPYALLERRFADTEGREHLLRVGVIGFVPPRIMVWDRAHLEGRVTVRDIRESAQRLVPRLRAAGADVVVAIAHSGLERGTAAPMADNSVAALARVPGVDAIVFGHSHGEFPGRFYADFPGVDVARGTVHGVPAVMPGRWGDHLGVIDLVLRREGSGEAARWRVVEGRSEIRPVRDRAARRSLAAPDPEIERLVAARHQATLQYVRSEVARSTAPVQSYFAQVADEASVGLVHRAQLARGRQLLADTPHAGLPLLSAAAPFKSGGRQGPAFYTDIPAGPVAIRNVADLYVFPNTLQVVRLTGAQLREYLEMAAGQFRRIDPAGPAEQPLIDPEFRSYNFDSVAGVTYAFDLTQPARYDRSGRVVAPQARRVADLRHQGQPVRDDQVFAMVTNNYRASGGGNFPAMDGSTLILETNDANRDVIVDYLRAAGTVEPRALGSWRILPVPGVSLRFTAGAGGIPHLPGQPEVRLVRQTGDGFAEFELRPR
jgi:2',3'-cyclic-nucleotide 2'-phosphodiesterase/3'-nucleotidase